MSKASQNKDTYSGKQGEGEMLTILCKQRSLEDNRIKTMNCWRNCTLCRPEKQDMLMIQLWNAGNDAVLSGKRLRAEGEEGASEDEMTAWQHQLDGYELEQTLGDGEGQGHLVSTGSQRVGHNWVTERQSAKERGKIHSHLVARSKQKFSKNMADLWYVINKTSLTHL